MPRRQSSSSKPVVRPVQLHAPQLFSHCLDINGLRNTFVTLLTVSSSLPQPRSLRLEALSRSDVRWMPIVRGTRYHPRR